MAIGQHKRLLLAGRVQHLATRRHRALQVLAQEGIGQFAKPLVGRILMVALVLSRGPVLAWLKAKSFVIDKVSGLVLLGLALKVVL